MKNDIQIKSTHSTLESAIEAAGGLNREYNARLFDKEVARINEIATRGIFYVLEQYGRDIVAYHYEADITLINEFSPFSGGCLSSSMTIGWKEGDSFTNVKSIDNNKANREKISNFQKAGSSIFALNF